MLTKRQQRKFLNKRKKQWQEQLTDFGSAQSSEALHQLRVTIKKIKAFARFSNATSGAKMVRDADLMKKMFRQAGIIRDAGNHLQLLEHFHPAPEEYKQEQQHIQSTAATTFLHHLKQYRREGRKAGRRLLTDIRKIPVQNIRDWYATQLIKISVLLTATGDQLHRARKLIKELLYVQSLLPQKITNELKLNKDYLDQLQDAIGQWHDAAIVADAWAGKDLGGSQAMIRECREKLAAVRSLAGEFYLRARLS